MAAKGTKQQNLHHIVSKWQKEKCAARTVAQEADVQIACFVVICEKESEGKKEEDAEAEEKEEEECNLNNHVAMSHITCIRRFFDMRSGG